MWGNSVGPFRHSGAEAVGLLADPSLPDWTGDLSEMFCHGVKAWPSSVLAGWKWELPLWSLQAWTYWHNNEEASPDESHRCAISKTG